MHDKWLQTLPGALDNEGKEGCDEGTSTKTKQQASHDDSGHPCIEAGHQHETGEESDSIDWHDRIANAFHMLVT